MENTEGKNKRMYREQLITIGDLELFKIELTELLTNLLKGNVSASSSKKWLKSLEVRKLLGISAGKLLTLRINGTLPFTKIGGIIYYDQDDIQDMFSTRKIRRP